MTNPPLYYARQIRQLLSRILEAVFASAQYLTPKDEDLLY